MKTKKEILQETELMLKENSFSIETIDDSRPWGGFFVIQEKDAKAFASHFFPDVNISSEQKISPKILLVEPGKKLSWQYHHRRAELWKLIDGEAGIIRSLTDEETALENMNLNQKVELEQGERHRLVGLNNWGCIAEIWMHTDPNNPSNEDDIVRINDEFGRN